MEQVLPLRDIYVHPERAPGHVPEENNVEDQSCCCFGCKTTFVTVSTAAYCCFAGLAVSSVTMLISSTKFSLEQCIYMLLEVIEVLSTKHNNDRSTFNSLNCAYSQDYATGLFL